MLERGVRLLLHTRFVDVIERDGRLAEAIVAGPSGPEALRAHCFVDSTDDGLVAEAAGIGAPWPPRAAPTLRTSSPWRCGARWSAAAPTWPSTRPRRRRR
ncbi:MAG: FAD-dependent oxidoreductase [Spirochaetaceae bacterium]|nr:FAD-dependent oxidoreductase [Spirochaetaceae bacterium]